MLITYGLYFLIVRRDIVTLPGRFVALSLFTFNSNLIFHALELRPYAVLPALALCLYWVSSQWNTVGRSWSKPMPYAWAALVSFTLLFHAYGLWMCLVVVGYSVWAYNHTRADRLQALKRLLAPTIAGVFISLLPLWYFIRSSFGFQYGVDTFEFSGEGAVSVLKFVVANLGDISIRYGWLLPALLIAGGVALPLPGRSRRILYMICLIAIPIAILFLQDIKGSYWFLQRQFVWVMPFASLLAALSMDSIVLFLKKSTSRHDL